MKNVSVVMLTINIFYLAHTVLCNNDSYINVLYYEVKPYIFTNSKGKLDGIFPMIMSQACRLCMDETYNKQLVKFVHKFESQAEFAQAFQQSNGTGYKEFENVAWFPVLFKDIEIDIENLIKQKDERSRLTTVTATQLAVIIARDEISLINKVATGLDSCKMIFFITLQMAVFFGILLWLFERRLDNDDFPKSYIKGISAGLWWSFTLGYNDKMPRSTGGQIVAMCWVFVIVLVASIMTAGITSSVTENLNFSKHNRTVVFVKNSWEESFITNDFHVKHIAVESYDEVISNVRTGKAYAGIMNADIASWKKDDILDDTNPKPLRITQLLPVETFVDTRMPRNLSEEVKNILRCMTKYKEDIFDRSIKSYKKIVTTEVLYLDTIPYLIKNNVFVHVLLSIVCVFLIVGFALAMYTRKMEIENNIKRAYSKKKKIKENFFMIKNSSRETDREIPKVAEV